MTDRRRVQSAFRSEITRALFYVLVCMLVGFFFGMTYSGLVIAVLALLARYVFVLVHLIRWLFLGKEPPSSNDLLYLLIDRIQRSISKQELRKKQATNLARGFRDLLRALPDAIVLVSKEKKIEWFNERAQRLLPLEKGDTGNLITALIRKPEFVQFIQNKDYSNTPVIQMQTDSFRHLRVHKIIYNSQSDLLVFRDITRIHQLQQQQATFIAHASHELNTPLTVIRGYTELAQQGLQHNQEGYQLLQKSINETDRLASLTRDLLTLARLDQQTPKQKESWFDPATLLRNIVEQLQSLQPYSVRKVVTEVDDNLLLRANQTEMSTVFGNIIENALKYSPEDTPVIISWQQTHAGAGRFFVADKGKGIDREHIHRVTERFYRISPQAGKSDPGGTGLGLSIVQAVLDLYHSELRIEANPPHGSKVSCLFPAAIVQQAS